MNERIKELAKQSIANVRFWNAEKESYDVDHNELEKFAELIVRECLTVITPTEHDTGSYVDFSNGLKLSQVRIKKHFGVE